MRPKGAMHLKKRRRRRLYRLLLVLLALGLAAWLKWQYLPTVRALVTMQVDDETSDLICQAVSETLEAQNLTYTDLICLSEDRQGRIIALQTDLIRAGRFRSALLQKLSEQIPTLTEKEIRVPIGDALLPSLFSGRGGAIPLRVLALRASNAEFNGSFTSAGINQTLHRVDLDVTVLVRVLCPAGVLDLEVSTTVPVAQTVIVGEVPHTLITGIGE